MKNEIKLQTCVSKENDWKFPVLVSMPFQKPCTVIQNLKWKSAKWKFKSGIKVIFLIQRVPFTNIFLSRKQNAVKIILVIWSLHLLYYNREWRFRDLCKLCFDHFVTIWAKAYPFSRRIYIAGQNHQWNEHWSTMTDCRDGIMKSVFIYRLYQQWPWSLYRNSSCYGGMRYHDKKTQERQVKFPIYQISRKHVPLPI